MEISISIIHVLMLHYLAVAETLTQVTPDFPAFRVLSETKVTPCSVIISSQNNTCNMLLRKHIQSTGDNPPYLHSSYIM